MATNAQSPSTMSDLLMTMYEYLLANTEVELPSWINKDVPISSRSFAYISSYELSMLCVAAGIINNDKDTVQITTNFATALGEETNLPMKAWMQGRLLFSQHTSSRFPGQSQIIMESKSRLIETIQSVSEPSAMVIWAIAYLCIHLGETASDEYAEWMETLSAQTSALDGGDVCNMMWVHVMRLYARASEPNAQRSLFVTDEYVEFVAYTDSKLESVDGATLADRLACLDLGDFRAWATAMVQLSLAKCSDTDAAAKLQPALDADMQATSNPCDAVLALLTSNQARMQMMPSFTMTSSSQPDDADHVVAPAETLVAGL